MKIRNLVRAAGVSVSFTLAAVSAYSPSDADRNSQWSDVEHVVAIESAELAQQLVLSHRIADVSCEFLGVVFDKC